MPSNNLRPSIASIGLKSYLDGTAHVHNGTDYAWFEDAMRRYEAGEMTKTDIRKAMNISALTLDKYIFIRTVEKVQHGN